MTPRPFSVGDKMVRTMRHRLDFILSDCGRYFKRHEPTKWAAECSSCNRHQGEAGAQPSGYFSTDSTLTVEQIDAIRQQKTEGLYKSKKLKWQPANHEPCGMAFSEAMRIMSMLWGIGLSDRYAPKKSGVRMLHNRFGRITIIRGKEDER